MKKVLTIVIPTYNMEKYLSNCLDSFLYDEKTEELEVLIVNDGSKDNSVSIAKEYEKKYPKIFKLIDKENGGHGSTINAGLKVAKGKYFKVVDADDWVDTSQFKLLVDYLRDSDVDAVSCNYTKVYEQTNKSVLENCSLGNDNCIIDLDKEENYKFAMHAMTFKTENIKDVRLQEKCFYVDVEYDVFCYIRSNNMIFLDLNIYQYRLGRPGQSVSIAGAYKHRENHLRVVKSIINILETSNNISDIKYKTLLKYITEIIRNQYSRYIFCYHLDASLLNEAIDFDKWLKANYESLYNEVYRYGQVKSLRKKNFKNIGWYNFIFRCKQFVKKLLGRAY